MVSPKKFPTLPAAPNWVLTKEPFTFSAPEDIGEPVSGVSMRIPFQFVVRPPLGVSIKSAYRQCPSYNQAEYEKEQEEANRIQKENQSIFNNTMVMDDTNNDNNGGSGSERATKKTKMAANWKCHKCMKMNADDESTCLGCNDRKAVNPDGPQGWGDTFQNLSKGKWKCLDCSAYNNDILDSCAACDIKKGEGGSSTEASSASAPALTSNSAIALQPASLSGAISSGFFSFGAAAPPAAPSGSNIGTGGFSFGSATTATPAETSGFSFSESNDAISTASTPSGSGFVFNAAKPPPPSTSENGVKPKPFSLDDSKPV
jgi:hypothetical protein